MLNVRDLFTLYFLLNIDYLWSESLRVIGKVFRLHICFLVIIILRFYEGKFRVIIVRLFRFLLNFLQHRLLLS